MNKLKKKIWIPVIQRQGESVLMVSYLMTAYQDQYHQEILLLPRGVHDTKYLDGVVIIEANDFGAFESSITERLSLKYLNYFVTKCRNESDNLLRTTQKIRSKAPYDSLTNAKLLLLFKRYSNKVIHVMPFLFGIVTLEGVLQKKLGEKITKHCKQHNIKADLKLYFNALIFPKEKNIPSLALIELYNLAAEVDSDTSLRKLLELSPTKALPQLENNFPEFTNKLNIYLEKYDFMNMEYYTGSPITAQELLGRIKDVVDDAKDRLARIKQDHKKTKKEFKQASHELRLTPELRSYIDVAQKIHYLRQYRADALFKAGRDVFELMTTIAKRFKIDYETLITLTWSEISESLVKERLTVNSKTITARQAGYGMILVDGKVSYVTGDALAKELTSLPELKKEVKKIKGTIAFSGTYQGRVVIVTTYKEIEKVREGDVLISPMTDPYYVSAMTRAGAIVTDEGGILSHAAIISRELGIPCIIGTKIATKVLKDGDNVEVDANKGIVKKLE